MNEGPYGQYPPYQYPPHQYPPHQYPQHGPQDHRRHDFQHTSPGAGAGVGAGGGWDRGGHWHVDDHGRYGQADHQTSGIGTPAIITIVLLVIVILVVGGLLVARVILDSDQQPAAGAPQVADNGEWPAGAGGISDPETVTVTSTPTSSPAPTTNDAARDRLDELVRAGEPVVEAVEYSWVPQLSSKRDGLVSEGRTWDHRAILEEFEDFRDSYPNATLLWSSDWSVFEPGWYVTIVAEPSSDYDTVLRWCRNQGYSSDNCLAKNIQRNGSVSGTTRTN